MKKKKLVIVIFSIVVIATLMAAKVFQNDTFYTIKVGESIIKYGIDMKDHFSWHLLAYSYPHWLYDVVVYFIYSLFSYRGLYIFNIIIFIILGLVFYYVNLNINKRFMVVSIMSILIIPMISSYVVVRAQSISYILFLLEIYFIKKLLETNKNRYVIYLLGISVLICNVHIAVWPLYFILYLPYVVEYIFTKFERLNIYKFLEKMIRIDKESNIKKLLTVMLISLFTGLLSPLKDMPYTYFIRTSLGNSQDYILEHARIGFSSPVIVISLIIVMLLLIFFIVRSKNKIRIVDIFMILGLGVMVVLSQRHFSLFIVLGMIHFTSIVVTYLDGNDSIINMLFETRIFLYIVIVEVIIIAGIKFMSTINKDYIDKELYPVQAVKYLKKNRKLDNSKIFNEYNFGSYLVLNDIKVFIDSRADLYTKEFSGLEYDIFDDYVAINKGDIEKLLDYDIDIVLVYSDTLLADNLNNMYDYVNIYQDDNFVIYEKRDS